MKFIFFFFMILSSFSCQRAPDTIKKQNTTNQNEFLATLVDGKTFHSTDYENVKLLLGFFSYRHKDAPHMLNALKKLKPYEHSHNFRIVLVSIDSGHEEQLQKFLKGNGTDSPVIVEGPGLELAGRFAIEHEVTLMGLSNKHESQFGFKKYVFADMPDGEATFLDYVKESLAIKSYRQTKPRLGIYPAAPEFAAGDLNGKTIRLADYRGKAVMLVFFSPKCPVCQQELNFVRDKLYDEFHPKGFEVLALSVLPLEGEALKLYNSFHYKWPVIDDAKRRIRNLYSGERSVPENYFIDQQGRIREASVGYNQRKEDIYTMWVKSLLGLPNPPLLSAKQFNGADSCRICHEPQYVSWSVTPHAHAWATLQIKGEDTNPECVGCHSVGFKDARGYFPIEDKRTGKEAAQVASWFQEVQCENCHGIGGPHVTEANMLVRETLEKTCLECHTAKFSLHFDFDERIKKVNHSNAEEVMNMSEEERLALLKKVAKKPGELFDTDIAYVGSQACQGCHGDIYGKWHKTPHAQAFDLLEKSGKVENADCLACHTVGYGEATGYAAHIGDANFQGVGCESCHGPGAGHVASKNKDDIRGLGDDCPFCVIEQICLSCHDAQNDADFNIHKGLDEVRKLHGYVEE